MPPQITIIFNDKSSEDLDILIRRINDWIDKYDYDADIVYAGDVPSTK